MPTKPIRKMNSALLRPCTFAEGLAVLRASDDAIEKQIMAVVFSDPQTKQSNMKLIEERIKLKEETTQEFSGPRRSNSIRETRSNGWFGIMASSGRQLESSNDSIWVLVPASYKSR